ncbi:hypothetical protein AB7783_09345 [Tardiphaga sp. 172_B4_N1_3]|uniref:hypothetical protein n=1 Tax=Tardiphaga sp. 172_B4_N1_3 TaxID=3240787 RepID=UPI003F8AEE90
MFDVTSEGANFWFDAFNVMLFVGAFAVAVGTYGSIRMGAAKERFSDERTSANEAKTQRAVADSDAAKEGAAKANERIAELSTRAAEANARTKEAEESLERLKLQTGPRMLDVTKLKDALSVVKTKASVNLKFAKDQSEPWWFANQIYMALIQLQWEVSWPTLIEPEDTPPNSIPGVPPMSGLLLISNNQKDMEDETTPLGALLKGLAASAMTAHISADPRVPNDVVKILVSGRTLVLLAPPKDAPKQQ